MLSNHDVVRHVTRYGRQDTSFNHSHRQLGAPTDRALGTRRARAAALLAMALPGAVYLYQGEELGLWEVEDLPDEVRQDPVWERSGHTEPGRDGCRVPIPWDGTAPPFDFSPTGRSWLPQPPEWRDHTVAAESADPDSMLSLYRAALRLRRDLTDESMAWLPQPTGSSGSDGVLAFSRGPEFVCVANLSGESTPLPTHQRLLIASGPLDAGLLPTDTAVWLRP